MTDETELLTSSALRSQLAASWRAGEPDFFVAVTDDLAPRLSRYLRGKFSSLSDEDLEDCISAALARFIERGDRTIENPQAYLWQMAKNEAFDLCEERNKTCDFDDNVTDEVLHAVVDVQAATILIEGLIEDIDAESSWAPAVVAVAVSRLRPALQRTIRYVLAHGSECNAETAAADLGTTAATFRANKSNGYSALRSIIPLVIAEMSIALPSPRLQEVFAIQHEFASDSS